MKLFLPKQHGAWAMLIIPFWLAVVASTFVWQHIPFFLGWLLLYLATYPMLLLFNKRKRTFHLKWTIIYFVPAIILLLIPLWKEPKIIYFALLMVPFFIINAYFAKENNERALLNDISAIMSFAIAGLAAAFVGEGALNDRVIVVFITSILFFVCSTFYVKSMIRERKNINFKYYSWGSHILMVSLSLILGKWMIAVAFLLGLIRAIYYYGKQISIMKLGIIEIINATWFFLWMIFELLT